MTEPDEALLWARERAKRRFSSPVYINICAQIDAGDWDDDLAYSAEAYRAGAAASDDRIKELEDGILDMVLYIEELADIEDWNEVVADGGITVDMIIKQSLKTVIAATLRRLL